jgi:DNA polymerase III subunit delta
MELVKLVSYVDGERAIRESDLVLLTPYRPEANVFHLVEAAASGQIKQALTLLSMALDQDPSDPGFGILALLINQFRRLLLVKDHLEQGGSLDTAASALGLKANQQWLVQKQYAPQARKFSYADLDRHYRQLHRYDKDIKTGRIAPRLALDLFITGLAQKA